MYINCALESSHSVLYPWRYDFKPIPLLAALTLACKVLAASGSGPALADKSYIQFDVISNEIALPRLK